MIVLIFLLLVAGLRIGAQPHPDEVWTVNAVRSSLPELVGNTVLKKDNHPPLFYILIKGFQVIGGEGLGWLRLLPLLLSFLTILALRYFLRRETLPCQLATIGLVGTNPLFVYYATTLRPYSLVVLMATLVTFLSLALRAASGSSDGAANGSVGTLPGVRLPRLRLAYWLSLIVLSLSHYFAFGFAALMLLVNMVKRVVEPRRWVNALLLILISLWPLIHFLFGALGSQTVHNKWVNVVPVLSTVNNFLMGVFPLLLISKQPQLLFSVVVCLAIACSYSLHLRPARIGIAGLRPVVRAGAASDFPFLAVVVAMLVLAACLVDLKTPLSTPYYFLVCLPAVAYGVARLFDTLIAEARRAWIPVAVLVLTLLLQVMLAFSRLVLP